MKKFLTPKDLAKIENNKGQILMESGAINVIERNSDAIELNTSVYTVWNFVEGFVFTHTQNYAEAVRTFEKYISNK